MIKKSLTNVPLLSILIPCYNGEPYLDVAFHSIFNQSLIDSKVLSLFEIIIVDDGSKDKTYQNAKKLAKIANAKVRTDFVRVFTKPNGQYGSVINFGLTIAQGTYFKVLDVDDSFNTKIFIELLEIMNGMEATVDVIYTDHTFEKVGVNKQVLVSWRRFWNPYIIYETKSKVFPNDLITMHSIIYRTNLLREIAYKQVEGVYYSDSQYSLLPLTFVKTFYYLNLPLYRYYIGRHEQSVNLKVMVARRNDQLMVLHTIIKALNVTKVDSNHIAKYLQIALTRLLQWQVVLITLDRKVKNKSRAVMDLINNIKTINPKLASLILKNIFFIVIITLRAHLILPIVKIGVKIYAKVRKNILAEWD